MPDYVVGPWYCENHVEDCVLRVVGFPYAGGGIEAFKEWPTFLPDRVEFVAVQLPGRGARRREAAHESMNKLVDELFDELHHIDDKPMIFFGHSLGAWIAYELIRRMESEHKSLPLHLIVSGSLPITLNRLPPLVHTMTEEELVRELRVLGGTSEQVLNEPDLLRIFSPTIQADFKVFETHKHQHRTPLDIDLSIWAALDDPRIPSGLVPMWMQLFGRSVKDFYFKGGHMFFNSEVSGSQCNDHLNDIIVQCLKMPEFHKHFDENFEPIKCG